MIVVTVEEIIAADGYSVATPKMVAADEDEAVADEKGSLDLKKLAALSCCWRRLGFLPIF